MSHASDRHVSHGVETLLEGRRYPTLKEEWLSRAYRARIPLSVTLELTQRCNLRCSHCYVPQGASAPSELPLSRWIEVVGDLAGLGTASVALTGGEVTLREGWLEVAREVRRQRLMLVVLTNGTRMDAAVLDKLADLAPVRVAVSIYGSTASAHDAVTGVEGSFEASFDTVRGLVERQVPCRVSTVLMQGIGAHGASDVKSMALGLGCDFSCGPLVYPRSDGSLEPTALRVRPDEYRRFVEENLGDLLSDHRHLIETDEDVDARGVANCRAGIMGAFVQADGDVLPCMGWPPAFGSVATGSFAAAWNGPVAQAHRERMLQPLTECSSCDISGLCLLRCPKLAELEGGDMSGICPPACVAAEVVAGMRRQSGGQGQPEKVTMT